MKGILGPSIVTICLGCIGGFHFLKSNSKNQYLDAEKTVSELLKQQNWNTLSFDDSQNGIWDKIIISYKNSNVNSSERFGEISGSQEGLRTRIKESCKEIVEKPTKSLDNYNKALRWCVVPQTVEQRLKLKNKVPFKFDQNNKTTIIEIAKQYKEKKINGFQLSTKSNDEDLFKEMERACGILLKVENYDKNFDSKVDIVDKLCSIKNID